MSDEPSGRPGRARRRTSTAPEPILGDLQRERWRADLVAVRTQHYHAPRGGVAAELEPDAVIADLEVSGPALAPQLAARIAAMGPRITTELLVLVERAVVADDNRPDWSAHHALAMLAYLRDPATLPRLLGLVNRPENVWLTPKLTTALRAFGRDLVEPAIATYRSTSDADHRALLLEVLTGSRVTDPRIRDLCCEWLELEPAFGADMLVDYGDPAAVEVLRARLSEPTAEPLDDEHLVALYAAIECLGGTLTPFEEARAERAIATLTQRDDTGS